MVTKRPKKKKSIPGMATPEPAIPKIHGRALVRLYLREHRRAKGMSAETVAGRMGYDRTSVLRLEREARTRVNDAKALAYAAAIGLDDPRALARPPGAVSLDALVQDQPPEIQEMAADIVRRLIAGRR